MKKFNVTVNGNVYEVEVEECGGAPAVRSVAAAPAPVAAAAAPKAAPKAAAPAVAAGSNVITAPMSGTIAKIKVKVGQSVKRGDVALLLEAMKMENELFVAADGVVKEIRTTEGTPVQPGDVLVVLG